MAHIVVKRRSIQGIATGLRRLGYLKCARLKFVMSYKELQKEKDLLLMQLKIEYRAHIICHVICHYFSRVIISSLNNQNHSAKEFLMLSRTMKIKFRHVFTMPKYEQLKSLLRWVS